MQVLELLADHLRQWATCIAFPEAAHLPCVALRGFIKGCAVERFRRSAKQLVDALERNIVYVGAARDGVAFAPQDLAAAGRFMADERVKAKVRRMRYVVCLYYYGFGTCLNCWD
jgi:nucleolar complex protein 2